MNLLKTRTGIRGSVITLTCVIASALLVAWPGAAHADQWYYTHHLEVQARVGGLCLDADANAGSRNGARVQMWRCNGQFQQHWIITRNVATGSVFIQNGLSGNCLDADTNTINQDGTRLQLWACNGGSQQRWTVNSQGADAGYRIRNVASGRVLDVAPQTATQNGGQVYLWTSNNQIQQRFCINNWDAPSASCG